jgi:hypothetical protein
MDIKPAPEDWRKKNAEVWEKIERALSTLSTEGMIASIECFTYNKAREPVAPEGQECKVECILYFRDTDDEGNPAGLFYLDKSKDAMRDSSGNCTFCGAGKDTSSEPYETRGRFRCPIKFCGHWAPPSFKRKIYSGFFRAVFGGEAIFEGPCRSSGEQDSEPMTNEEQIEAIRRVMTEAFRLP